MRLHAKVGLILLLITAGALGATPPSLDRPGWLGLGYSYHLAAERSHPNWLYVERLAPDGPAERAGLHTQDVITAIDGKPLRFVNLHEVMAYFAKVQPGQIVTFAVVRPSGKQSLPVAATPMPDEAYKLWILNTAKANSSASRPPAPKQ